MRQYMALCYAMRLILPTTFSVTLFRQFIVRALLRDRARTVVTLVGLTLGVAVVVAIRLANASSIRGFETALDGPWPARPRSRSSAPASEYQRRS